MPKECNTLFFFFQAEDGIRDYKVTGVQTCALPISALARLARARDDEGRARRRARDGVAEAVERGLGRRADDGGHVRAGNRILAADQQLPLREKGLIPGVERIESREGEWGGAPELDRAQSGARAALSAEVAVDQVEALAPPDRCPERGVDHLVARERGGAGRERRDARQEAIAAGEHVAGGRRLTHERTH